MRIATLRKLQRVVAVAAPTVILASSIWQSVQSAYARNVVLSSAFLFVMAATLSVTLYKRSKGLEAAWFNARAMADPTESLDQPVYPLSLDVALVLGAVAFTVVSVFQL